jgi:hypothetical protein
VYEIHPLKDRPGVYLNGEKNSDLQQFQHDEIITSPEEPSVLVNLTYTFHDVEKVHEGFATSDFFVLGKLQQPQKMKFSESPDSITCKKMLQENVQSPNILAEILFFLLTQNCLFPII